MLSLEGKNKLATEFKNEVLKFNVNCSLSPEDKKTKVATIYDKKVLIREPKDGGSGKFTIPVSKNLLYECDYMAVYVKHIWVIFSSKYVISKIDKSQNTFVFNFDDNHGRIDSMMRIIKNDRGH